MVTGFGDYDMTDHAACGDLTEPLHALNELCFGSYPEVIRPSLGFMRWYLQRPGMDPTLCMAALQGEQLVASLFVTVAEMRLGGRLLPVGIVDTVMTHPEHRQRGLARRLLESALERMRRRGLAASLLYTFPDTVPFRLYRSLGYQPYAPTSYYHYRVHSGGLSSSLPCDTHTNPAAGDPTLRSGGFSRSSLMAFLDAHLGSSDGYIPLTPALWRWRKIERPPELPAEVRTVEQAGRLVGCLTLCRAPITSETTPFLQIITDLAIAPAADGPAVLAALLQGVPQGAGLLAPAADHTLQALLQEAGFQRRPGETGMVAPLSPEAAQAISAPPQSWYVAVESVIGV